MKPEDIGATPNTKRLSEEEKIELKMMEKLWFRSMHPTLADEIREYIGIGMIFIIYILGFIYGHERILKFLNKHFTIKCDSEGNPI